MAKSSKKPVDEVKRKNDSKSETSKDDGTKIKKTKKSKIDQNRRKMLMKQIKGKVAQKKQNGTEEPVVEESNKREVIQASDLAHQKRSFYNTQRTLVFGARGITSSHRHLMKNIQLLLPHSKSDTKFDTDRTDFTRINKICESKKCNNVIFFEAQSRGTELFMHVAKSPIGPTLIFKVLNVTTMEELKLTGNCLKYSRPVIHFDKTFEAKPELKLIKEMFTQIFASPKHHPKNKPFIDHVFSFFVLDDRIWFRNYQISDRVIGSGEKNNLVEIGPRFCLELVRILDHSFEGDVLFNSDTFVPKYQTKREEGEKEQRDLSKRRRRKVMKRNYLVKQPLDEIKAVWFNSTQIKDDVVEI